MALTRPQKEDVIADTTELLENSKLTVVAKYPGTSVKALQELRRNSSQSGTKVMVIKNRLFKKALLANDNLKNIDTSSLTGQLIYAFNAEDEVAPAQNLAAFQVTNPQLEFVCAITSDGQLLATEEVKALASLPSKQQLRAQLLSTFKAPTSSFVSVLAGNVRSMLYIFNARVDKIK